MGYYVKIDGYHEPGEGWFMMSPSTHFNAAVAAIERMEYEIQEYLCKTEQERTVHVRDMRDPHWRTFVIASNAVPSYELVKEV